MIDNNKTQYYNLTHPQKRIWYVDKINLNSPLHNIGGCINTNKHIDVNFMKKTINFVIEANEGLRLRFREDERPVQYVQVFEKENIDFLDFSSYKNPKDKFQNWIKSIMEINFQLQNNKLYYFAIYKISKEEYGVFLKIHHIISDGWTITLMQKQICEIYTKLVKGEIMLLDNYKASYLEFIEYEKKYLNSNRFAKNKKFWNEKFRDLPEGFLYNSSNSLKGKRKSFELDSQLSGKIQNFIKETGYSLNTFFTVILLIYINKMTNKNDIVIGMPIFNRSGKKQKSTVGMFTTTLPFRFNIDSKLNLNMLINEVNKELKSCFYNQNYPYDVLIKDLKISEKGYDSLFKISLNYYNSKYSNSLDDINVEIEEGYCGNQSYSLQLTVKEWKKDNINLNFDYKVQEYTDQEIEFMYKYIINLVIQILGNKSIKIKDLKLIDDEENNYKLYKINSTYSYYSSKTVYELFEEQVFKNPNKIAIEFEGKKITYKELNEKSNQLANYLKKDYISKGKIVGIIMTHSIELIISIMGVIKAGKAYLPIDPSYPIERINYILEDSNTDILFTNIEIDKIRTNSQIININEIDLDLFNKENLEKINKVDDLVYIIYTSGSTGKPKGVMIEHKGLVNYISWAVKRYLRDEDEVMPLYSSVSFDLTVTTIFAPLVSGNKIIIYDNDENEFVLYKILRENKCTVVKLTPAHLMLLKDEDNRNSNIKRFIVGGENLKVSLANEISKSFAGDIEIYNEYGPTETVVGCMTYKYNADKDKGISVPIGYPIDNTQIYILDNEFNVAANGEIGELYISGDGVARGYLNREDLTKEKFIDNPFIQGKRMYKTGDLAKYLNNKTIEYIGRNDNQAKIRGHRIEIGEIERCLLENECIKDAVVIVTEGRDGNKLLDAYVVNVKKITDIEIKKWLIDFLPKYMIPNNFIFIDKLPLTLNGKIDYKLLPKKESGKRQFINYKNKVEKKLVTAMEEILGVKSISMNDNYYQLGGDSIKAIQLSSSLSNVGLALKVKDILACDTIAEIAAVVEGNEEAKSINQGQRTGGIKKTPILEWFFKQNFKNNNIYNQYVLLQCNNTLDINNVNIAVRKLIEHHDELRLNYCSNRKTLYYNNKHLNNEYFVEYTDLAIYENEKYNISVENLVNKANISFDIENDLLFNVSMFNLKNEKQAVLFTAHHLIVDGVSWRIILSDFISILNQLKLSNDVKLPMKTSSFKEWTEKLQEYSNNDFSKEKSYWDYIQNNDYNYYFNTTDTVEKSSISTGNLSEYITNRLMKDVNRIYNIDINETLIIALAININKFIENRNVIIEFERHGREYINENIDVSRTIGWFTSMYPISLKVDSNNINENIKSIKEQLRNVPNNGFNYSILKYLKNEIKYSEGNNVRFNYLGNFDNIIDKNLDVENIEFGLKSDSKNLLTALLDIVVLIINNELTINITYSNERFNKAQIQEFINGYKEVLNSILDECNNKDVKEFTPSDFENVNISQEELEDLFE